MGVWGFRRVMPAALAMLVGMGAFCCAPNVRADAVPTTVVALALHNETRTPASVTILKGFVGDMQSITGVPPRRCLEPGQTIDVAISEPYDAVRRRQDVNGEFFLQVSAELKPHGCGNATTRRSTRILTFAKWATHAAVGRITNDGLILTH